MAGKLSDIDDGSFWPVADEFGADEIDCKTTSAWIREFDADGNELLNDEEPSLAPTIFAFQKKDNGNIVMLLLNPDAKTVTFATYRIKNSKVTIENVSKERGNELYKMHKNNYDFEVCDDTKAIVLIKRELRGFTYD